MGLQILGGDGWRPVKPDRKTVTFQATGIGPLRRDTRNLAVHANFEMDPGAPARTYRVTVEEV